MNDKKTTSILQRCAVILAVTAASYGLPQAQARTAGGGKAPAQQSQAAAQQR